MQLGERYGMPVPTLKRRITYKHFREIVEYERRNPHWTIQLYFYFAQVASVIVNMNRDRKQHPEPFPVEDFLIEFESTTGQRRMTLEESGFALCAAFGADHYGKPSNANGQS